MVHPVGLDDEFLVVHALPGDRHVGCPGGGVLLDQPFVTLEEHLETHRRPPARATRAVVEVFKTRRSASLAPQDEALKVDRAVE